MSYLKKISDKYQGYGWIEVPKYVDDPTLAAEQRLLLLQQHHKLETEFLIAEIRKLAESADYAWKHVPLPGIY
jgi:hypothetical protein